MANRITIDLLIPAQILTAFQRLNTPCKDIILNSEIRTSKENFKWKGKRQIYR